jgi:DivIVA domain-containing protein
MTHAARATAQIPAPGRQRLAVWHIRDRRFRRVWRGVDESEVRRFLHDVALAVDARDRHIAALQAEIDRLKYNEQWLRGR